MNTFCIIKRKFKPLWSTILLILKQTINSHLNSLNIKIPQHTTLKIPKKWTDTQNVAKLHQLMWSQLLPLVCTMLPMSLDRLILVAPSVFSNVYLRNLVSCSVMLLIGHVKCNTVCSIFLCLPQLVLTE